MSSISERNKKRLRYIWKIENFSWYTKLKGRCITSPEFKLCGSGNHHLKLYPNYNEHCFISLEGSYLRVINSDIICNFEIICYDGDSLVSKDCKPDLNDREFGATFNFSNFEGILKKKDKFLVADCLTIHFNAWGRLDTNYDTIYNYSRFVCQESFSLKLRLLDIIADETKAQIVCFSRSLIYKLKSRFYDDNKIKFQFKTCRSEKYLKLEIYEINHSGFREKQKFQDFRFDDHSEIWELITVTFNPEKRQDIYLEFGFSIYALNSEIIVETHQDECKLEPSSNSILDDIQEMYTNQKLTDIELHVEGKILLAHKFVLASRSAVFMTMLDQDMLEKKNNVIHIEDMSYRTLNEFLKFLYGMNLRDLNYDSAIELMNSAEKYQVLALKEECDTYLGSCLSVNNFLQVLSVSKLYGNGKLKQYVFDFVKSHRKIILSSEEWKNLKENDTDTAMEIYSLLVEDDRLPML